MKEASEKLRERERESEYVCVRERENVCVREKEWVCVVRIIQPSIK